MRQISAVGQKPSFIRVDDKNFIALSSRALNAYQGVTHSATASRDQFANFDGNISVRAPFSRSDYEYFRTNERIPTEPKDIIKTCRQAYRKVGIIRNVIDLMSDFGMQGIELTHPNSRIQKFFRGWFKRVRGQMVSERFLNLFYREGVAVVKRTMGRINANDEKRLKAMAAEDNTLEPDDVPPEEAIKNKKRNLPLRYNFLNPISLEVIGGEELSQFVGKNLYGLKISTKLRNAVQSPKTNEERQLVDMLPGDIRTAIKRGDTIIPLDVKKVRTFFYKKDDWQTWADPMTYAILDDLLVLEKMKLADIAALDGAISQIRLWKLGYINESRPEMSIFPTEAAIQRLADVLLSNPGGGAFDLIWGPELTVEEYKTNVHQFLGNAKYEPVRQSIYEGLGVPPTLTGAAGGSGFTNNYISLKTLIQRLEYGRAALREFWEYEIELVQQAMGFQRPAKVTFDRMVLTDESAEKALLIQLADRDIISVETVAERFGEVAEVEELRMRREARARRSELLPQKASPYHTAQQTYELIKVALTQGIITPQQAGIELPIDVEPWDSNGTPFDLQMKSQENLAKLKKVATPTTKKKGVAGQGRPRNSKDSTKRKRTPKPIGSSTASFLTAMLWTKRAQDTIAELVNPALLQHFGKTTMRAVSDEQAKMADNIKFAVLCNLKPYSEVSDEVVYNILSGGAQLPAHYKTLYDKLYASAVEKAQREPTCDELRTIHNTVYATLNSDEELIYG